MGDVPFEIIRQPHAMRAFAEDKRRDGMVIAVVPTMGYLHDGHLALLREARKRADLLIMTLFVNPTQFGKGEDLAQYPRDEQGDLAKARSAGVDVVFSPDAQTMYGPSHQTRVQVTELSSPLCGASRPGHFAGVATVVTKLFHLCCPHLAVFGQKDYQQLALIRQMVKDLDFGIEIASVPIVREADGLAMSSRNANLSQAQRRQAACIFRGLTAARAAFEAGVDDAGELVRVARGPIEAADLATIDYLELRDAQTLATVDTATTTAVVAAAVVFGQTRLIDNIVLTRE